MAPLPPFLPSGYAAAIANNSFNFKEFSSDNINFINQLFIFDGEFKDWNHIKREF